MRKNNNYSDTKPEKCYEENMYMYTCIVAFSSRFIVHISLYPRIERLVIDSFLIESIYHYVV